VKRFASESVTAVKKR